MYYILLFCYTHRIRWVELPPGPSHFGTFSGSPGPRKMQKLVRGGGVRRQALTHRPENEKVGMISLSLSLFIFTFQLIQRISLRQIRYTAIANFASEFRCRCAENFATQRISLPSKFRYSANFPTTNFAIANSANFAERNSLLADLAIFTIAVRSQRSANSATQRLSLPANFATQRISLIATQRIPLHSEFR